MNPRRKYSDMTDAEKKERNAQRRAARQRKKMLKTGDDVPVHIEPDYKSIIHSLQMELNRPLNSAEIEAVKSNARRNVFVQMFLKFNCNVAAACIATGISRSTYGIWLEKYPEFREAVTESQEALLDFAEEQLIKNIAAGKETSLIFYLCNKGKVRGWQSVNRMTGPTIKAMKFTLIDAKTGREPTRKRIASTVSGDSAVQISTELGSEN